MARISKEDFRKEPAPTRKRRKPMTEEQRAAAAERLAKAREEKAKNPPQLKSVHPDVLAKDDDDMLSYVKVKAWIKANKDKLPSLRQQEKQGAKGALAQYESVRHYINSMERYLKDSVWTNQFLGEDQEKRVVWRCIVPAFDADGNIKRQKGVYYTDIQGVWGEESDDNN
jgi:hypothetical protein